ncbi:unnamed protein product [Symbiodinium sp. CCMP2592]|nr:unnamed protein product [Symbiodinium sp. CCMP2592]
MQHAIPLPRDSLSTTLTSGFASSLTRGRLVLAQSSFVAKSWRRSVSRYCDGKLCSAPWIEQVIWRDVFLPGLDKLPESSFMRLMASQMTGCEYFDEYCDLHDMAVWGHPYLRGLDVHSEDETVEFLVWVEEHRLEIPLVCEMQLWSIKKRLTFLRDTWCSGTGVFIHEGRTYSHHNLHELLQVAEGKVSVALTLRQQSFDMRMPVWVFPDAWGPQRVWGLEEQAGDVQPPLSPQLQPIGSTRDVTQELCHAASPRFQGTTLQGFPSTPSPYIPVQPDSHEAVTNSHMPCLLPSSLLPPMEPHMATAMQPWWLCMQSLLRENAVRGVAADIPLAQPHAAVRVPCTTPQNCQGEASSFSYAASEPAGSESLGALTVHLHFRDIGTFRSSFSVRSLSWESLDCWIQAMASECNWSNFSLTFVKSEPEGHVPIPAGVTFDEGCMRTLLFAGSQLWHIKAEPAKLGCFGCRGCRP